MTPVVPRVALADSIIMVAYAPVAATGAVGIQTIKLQATLSEVNYSCIVLGTQAFAGLSVTCTSMMTDRALLILTPGTETTSMTLTVPLCEDAITISVALRAPNADLRIV
mmetsp:Transcript_24685/g.34447  ORF Transcript_24685/g.34447 Transcript_24685/m.34447 type:complete len:110 (-) Transcript_24685:111-440(-)